MMAEAPQRRLASISLTLDRYLLELTFLLNIIMKKTISALLAVFGFITIFASADVTFEIAYTDEPGEGFHIRPEAQKSLEEAVALVFSWLDHDAVVKIKVESFVDPSQITLATVETNSIKDRIIPGIYHTHLARKILFNEYENDNDYDAIISVNFANEDRYAYENELGSNQSDFKSIIMHELTHALGFTSWIQEGDEDIDESACLKLVYLHYQKLETKARNNVCWKMVKKLIASGISVDWMLLNYNNDAEAFTHFDTFLVDDKGNKLIDTESFKFLREDLFELEDEDPRKTLYFPIERSEGVKLYPLNGMDASHMRETLDTDSVALMSPAISRGLAFRQWPPLESKIMQILGYKLKPYEEDSWIWKCMIDGYEDGGIRKLTMGTDGVFSKEIVEAK